jgi:hypothetical protein
MDHQSLIKQGDPSPPAENLKLWHGRIIITSKGWKLGWVILRQRGRCSKQTNIPTQQDSHVSWTPSQWDSVTNAEECMFKRCFYGRFLVVLSWYFELSKLERVKFYLNLEL